MEMNGMILGAYEQAWRRGTASAWRDEFPPETTGPAADGRSTARWNAGTIAGFAALAIALFFAGASYA
jgi:hypothetical protein